MDKIKSLREVDVAFIKIVSRILWELKELDEARKEKSDL